MKTLLMIAFTCCTFLSFGISFSQENKELDSAYFLMEKNEVEQAQKLLRKNIRLLEEKKAHDSTLLLFQMALANTYMINNQSDSSLSILEDCEKRQKTYSDGQDFYFAALQNMFGLHYSYAGDLNKAEEYLNTAYRQYPKDLQHTTGFSEVVFNLSLIYYEKGNYANALTLAEQALLLRKNQLGEKNIKYGESCNVVGILCEKTGNYEKAETLTRIALAIFEESLGEENPMYVAALNNLALLFDKLEKNALAEEAYLKCLSLREKIYGKEHQEYGAVCNNIGIFYMNLGLYDKAKFYYYTALDIYEKRVGKLHPMYALICNQIAHYHSTVQEYERAEEFYLTAKNIRAEKLGVEHPEYATSCNNLGGLYTRKGDYEKAMPLYLEAKNIRELKLGKKHPLYAITCTHLGGAYSQAGDKEQAEKFYLEALQINEEVFGKEHFEYIRVTEGLSLFYLRTKQFDKSMQYTQTTMDNIKKALSGTLNILSEKEKRAYWTTLSPYFSSVERNFVVIKSEEAVKGLVNFALFKKGFLFSSNQKIKQSIMDSGDTTLVNLYFEWKNLKEKHMKATQFSAQKRQKEGIVLGELEEAINSKEKELSKKSPYFAQAAQDNQFTWFDLQKKVPKNTVVVEILQTSFTKKDKKDTLYVALFVTSNTNSKPEMLVLENGAALESKYLSYYKNAVNFKREDKISYEQFWKPIGDKLKTLNKKGFSKIYFSPDGVYHQISLNTLQNPETGKYLLEEENIQLIGTSRDLIEYGTNETDLSKNFAEYQTYMLGFPAYNLENKKSDTTKAKDRSFSAVERIMGARGAISMLPGTKTEIENLNRMFAAKSIKTKTFLSENASEENVKQMKNPTILHIATHGFFVPEVKESEVKTIQDAEKRNLLKNPFMRSGLLLAGCENQIPEGEDGVLTAEEAMNLNLDKTELVVLSACETGLGDIQAGEGVFGLQRAFQQAGAKTVLMSLWKVSDEATQMLMTEFYSALLGGKSKREAFKIAQMKLRQKFESPYYWGAFVMVGR